MVRGWDLARSYFTLRDDGDDRSCRHLWMGCLCIHHHTHSKHREQLLERRRKKKKTYEWIEQGTMRDRRPLLITTMFGQLINMISWLHNVCTAAIVHGSCCGKTYQNITDMPAAVLFLSLSGVCLSSSQARNTGRHHCTIFIAKSRDFRFFFAHRVHRINEIRRRYNNTRDSEHENISTAFVSKVTYDGYYL